MKRLDINYQRALVAALITVSLFFVSAKLPDKPIVKSLADNFELNVIYGHNINKLGKDQQLGLDVYWPANAEKGKKYPFVMLIHGGSFMTGRKERYARACRILADSGFVAVTIDYRMGWNAARGPGGCDADIPDFRRAQYRALQDTHAAMRFLMANADKYHIDKNWLFMGGDSAGGATTLALQYDNDKYIESAMPGLSAELGGIANATNDIKASFKLKGICDMWGGVTDSTIITKANALPTITFHGTGDNIAPFDHGHWVNQNCPTYPMLYGSACIYRRLKALNVPVILNAIIGGKHGPIELTPEHLMSNTACFFHSVINGKPHSGYYEGAFIGCR